MTANQRASIDAAITEPDAMSRASRVAHILVVDDDPRLRTLLQRSLTTNGYAVSTAEDGQAALEAVAARCPDLVISDSMMPRLDGMALVQALHDRYPSLPILVMTAHGSVDLQDVSVLAKPFSLGQLVAGVRTLLAESSPT